MKTLCPSGSTNSRTLATCAGVNCDTSTGTQSALIASAASSLAPSPTALRRSRRSSRRPRRRCIGGNARPARPRRLPRRRSRAPAARVRTVRRKVAASRGAMSRIGATGAHAVVAAITHRPGMTRTVTSAGEVFTVLVRTRRRVAPQGPHGRCSPTLAEPRLQAQTSRPRRLQDVPDVDSPSLWSTAP